MLLFHLVLYSVSLTSALLSAHLHPFQHHVKRQTPSLLDNVLNPLSSTPPGSNRLSNPSLNPNLNSTPNPTTSELPSNSSSALLPTNSSSATSKDSPLIPLLGSSLGNIPTPATSTNSSATPPTNSTSAPPTISTPLPSVTTLPSNKSSISTTPAVNSTAPLSTHSSDPPPSSRSSSTNPAVKNHAESRPSSEKSTFGSTTIKILAITGGVVAGLFLLWTVIRKWKFRPSKRFANKLEDYDAHMFEPRPPSFSEKRPNDFSPYPATKIPMTPSASPAPYPSHLPERSHTPHNIPRQNLFSQSPSPYPVQRFSNTSVTKPLPIFDSNYRLSLGLGSDISHSYPPADHLQPKIT